MKNQKNSCDILLLGGSFQMILNCFHFMQLQFLHSFGFDGATDF